MDKKQLDPILKNTYNLSLWRQVLTDVFSAKNLHQQPQRIENLPANSKDLVEKASELGFFNTTDDRIIGLYQIDLKPNVKIERNKVGLRELLRNIYKYDVDGALVVFVQGDKWRLSFISEIRVLNEDGSIDKRATEPKRYTYLLGRGEKTKTPTDRLFLLAGKPLALEDIRAAFSVEALNNEFYKQISAYFYELVGATTTKGKKTTVHERVMKLPGVSDDDRTAYQNFAVRLIGRTVFCWFLKVKKTNAGKPLLPEHLLSSEAVNNNKNYYHEILEPLFFQTLNTPMPDRIKDLPSGCETVPFLNGGLFEPQTDDFYNAESQTGNYQNYGLKIPDSWFERFFKTLEQYNFTIDENSPTEVEISVDPEMLGRIFENLLAEIDPDSGETARKATGSFYTPREIVNYMVDESLIIYLKSKLQEETVGYQSLKTPQATIGGNDWRVGQPHLEYPLNENRWQGKDKELEETLRRLFSYAEAENPFDETDTERLIKAIDDLKILDPACGSGAFPMGVLHRLVFLLGKLDRKNEKWKRAQVGKIDGLVKNADGIEDFQIRRKITDDLRERKAEIERDFENKEFDFGRKLFLIENCIYGVDIQPIAAEISKLRCFLTLIVDEEVSDNLKDNRGVKPLPNLEFKFVTADALLKLPAGGLFQATTDRQLAELESVRHEYINSYGAGKEAAKRHFQKIQDEIYDEQIKNNRENPDKRALALSCWKPFSHERVDWFDPLWMFGVKEFDIVIGNPPYVQMQKDGGRLAKMYVKENFQTFAKTGDIYCLFYEQGNNLLKKGGVLCYITSNSWLRTQYGELLRKYFVEKMNPIQLVNIEDTQVFAAATVESNIIFLKKENWSRKLQAVPLKNNFTLNYSVYDYFKAHSIQISELPLTGWIIGSEIEANLKAKIENNSTKLKDMEIQINFGIKTGLNQAFIIDGKTKDKLVALDRKNESVIKPTLRGRDLRRYAANFKDTYFLFIPWHFPLHNRTDIIGCSLEAEQRFKSEYPSLYDYLYNFKEKLEKRNQAETGIRYEWYALQRWGPTYYKQFDEPKIIWGELSDEPKFSYDSLGIYPEATLFFMVGKDLKYLLSVLNSKLGEWYFNQISTTSGMGTNRWKKYKIEQLPIKKISKEKQKPFENLVDYILFLKELDNSQQVNEYVPNSHLVEQFEEVIDALVYELYFEEDFRRASIAFLKYAEADFPSIEGKTPQEKIKTIHEAYQHLRQKDNPIRNNLKLMDIRLADLIMPIKTAR